MRSRRFGQQGYSLIELLVVVAIIGILASIAIPLIAKTLVKARVTTAGAGLRELHMALTDWAQDKSRYPTASEFKKTTLEPLVTDGIINPAQAKAILKNLDGMRITTYAVSGELYVAFGDVSRTTFTIRVRSGVVMKRDRATGNNWTEIDKWTGKL